jgi:predicted nucleic acid-binding protein
MIVLDSSFLIAYYNMRDAHHAEAARTMVRLITGEWGRAQLLEYVFLETVTVLRGRLGLDGALTAGDKLLEAEEVDFVPCSEIFPDVLTTFRRERADLSFTDAAIVTVARRDRKGVVATFDRDFFNVSGITVIPGGSSDV